VLVLVICVLVFTVICIVCTEFFTVSCIYSYLPPTGNSIAVNNDDNNNIQ
jgi:hypothetical protein